jgi:6,7-dimethyl-8-ribityllumazine synthase
LQPVIHQGRLNAEGFRFAVVASRWNDFLTSRLVEGALDALERLGADEKSVEVFKVPGSFEIPLMARRLAESAKWDAVICLGTIIRGETPHFDYVASEAASGLQLAGLETGVPVAFGVLTVDNIDQAEARVAKGAQAVRSALEMADAFSQLRSSATATAP